MFAKSARYSYAPYSTARLATRATTLACTGRAVTAAAVGVAAMVLAAFGFLGAFGVLAVDVLGLGVAALFDEFVVFGFASKVGLTTGLTTGFATVLVRGVGSVTTLAAPSVGVRLQYQ